MRTILKNVNLINGHKDMIVQPNMDIVIDQQTIMDIGQNLSVQNEDNVIDCTGQFVCPGLINMHVHLPGNGFPKIVELDNTKLAQAVLHSHIMRQVCTTICKHSVEVALASGVTTIRAVGGIGDIDSQIRDLVNQGKIKGPRMYVSNMAVTVPKGHMAGSVAYPAISVADAVRFVDQTIAQKPDLIKLMITGGIMDSMVKGEPGILRMPQEYVKACCDRAHEKGYKVAAHVESTEGLQIALENGVDTIEHGAPTTSDILYQFKKNHASLITTLSPCIPYAKFDQKITRVNDITYFNAQVVMNGIIENARSALEHDIPVGLGTDTVVPYITHYDMWRELVYFHKLVGVEPSFALYSATLGNATIAGCDEVTGSIDIGKSADMILLNANPLEDLSVLRSVETVIFRGKVWKNPVIKKNMQCEKLLDAYMNTL